MELTVNAINIRTLFGNEPKAVPVIPTSSNRKRVATGILNVLAQEHPEYTSAIHVLTVYPILRWVLDVRRLPGFQPETVTALPLSSPLVSPCPERSAAFSLYGKIVDVLESSMEKLRSVPKTGMKLYRTVMDIHAGAGADAVSIYQLNVYYKKAVTLICADCAGRLEELREALNMLTAEDYIHQTGMTNPAFAACRDLMSRCDSLPDDGRACLSAAVSALSLHPKDAEPMHGIMELLLSGIRSVDDLKDSTDYAWNTIARYRSQAFHALACLLWGYSIEELIFCLWEAQIEEQCTGD